MPSRCFTSASPRPLWNRRPHPRPSGTRPQPSPAVSPVDAAGISTFFLSFTMPRRTNTPPAQRHSQHGRLRPAFFCARPSKGSTATRRAAFAPYGRRKRRPMESYSRPPKVASVLRLRYGCERLAAEHAFDSTLQKHRLLDVDRASSFVAIARQ